MKILNTLFADIFYDNSQSGLKAQTLKSALDELNISKPGIDFFTGSLQLFATDANSDIIGFNRAVNSTAKSGFSFSPLDVETEPIIAQEQLIGQLMTAPGVIFGTIANLPVTTIGNIKRIDSNQNQQANFFFRVYHWTDGTEILLATSNLTNDITNDSYLEYSALAVINNSIDFQLTDRLIIRFFANPVGEVGGKFALQFGGSSPFRTNLFVPHHALPTSGNNITVNTAEFSGILNTNTFTLQLALDRIDNITGNDIIYDSSATGLIANSTQDAIDALFQLVFPAIVAQGVDGGEPSSTEYLLALDGGDPSGDNQLFTVDGGDPLGTRIDGGES